MSNPTGPRQQFGEGPLSRVLALVYNLLVIELLVLIAGAPGLVGSLLLSPDPSNAPLIAACALPLGPALSAAVYALHKRGRTLGDLRPARAFWRGYRVNFVGALQIWVPWLVWLTILAVNLAHPVAAGVPGWWTGLLVLVAGASTLWAIEALVITSLFTFRARDVARLAALSLARHPVVTLGSAGLLIIAAGVMVLSSEAVLALLGSVLAVALLRTCRPMILAIERDFTAQLPPSARGRVGEGGS